jgi:hypothetical protein
MKRVITIALTVLSGIGITFGAYKLTDKIRSDRRSVRNDGHYSENLTYL